jgi:antitoxin HicB
VTRKRDKHLGSCFEDFLVDEGLYEEVTSVAWKRVLSWEVTEAMKKGGISKSEMAKRMHTSRSQLERFLDPENPNVLLETVQKAASAIGKRITIALEDAPPRVA